MDKILNINVLTLAFMGDAVYEQFIREKIITENKVPSNRPDQMHKAAVKYVKAAAQSQNVRRLIEEGFLSEDEIALVKRARNHKIASKAKNATAIEYKWATAFEALLGYLYLSGKEERLKEIMEETYE